MAVVSTPLAPSSTRASYVGMSIATSNCSISSVLALRCPMIPESALVRSAVASASFCPAVVDSVTEVIGSVKACSSSSAVL